MKRAKEKARLSFWTSLLISMTFCVFGPLEMVMSNASEFWFSVAEVFPYIAVCAVVCFLAIFILSFVVAAKTKILYPVLLGLGIALYVQGNFMFVNYGVMDGTAIDWNSFGIWPIANAMIWLLLIAAPVILYFTKREWFEEIVVLVPAIVVAIQLVTLGTLALTTDLSKEAQGGDASLTVRGIDEVSEKGNVAMFILDTFEDTFFEEILENEPDYLKPLDGFTYFANNTGVYPTTKGAMPFILTGQVYRNEKPYSEYIQEAYAKTDYYKDLKNAGYDIGIYGEYMYLNSDAVSNYISNVDSASGLKASSYTGLMSTIYRATAFRYFPHAAKASVWYYSGDFDAWKTTTGEAGHALYKTGNLDLYNEIKKGEVHLTDSNDSCYRVFYAYGCHPPYKLREDMTESDDGSVTYLDATKGCLNIVYEYIAQLKELGVYDQTTIVVIADHGRTDIGFTSPVFLVKPRNSSGQLVVSNAPVSQQDLMATVMEDIGLNSNQKYGRSAFDYQEGETRSRTFLYYDWARDGSWSSDFLPKLSEYTIRSDNNDPSNFTLTNYDKAIYHLNEKLLFSADTPTAQPYCIYGISGFEPGSSWMSSKQACLAFKIEEPIQEDLVVSVDVSYVYGAPQDVTISMNGDELFHDEVCSEGVIQFIVPAERISDGEIELIFDLPGAISPLELGESEDSRLLSLSLSTMIIQKLSDSE